VSGQLHALATLPLGKEPLVPIGKEAGWAPEPIWTNLERREILPLLGLKLLPLAVQPIASLYTDCTILAPCLYKTVSFSVRYLCVTMPLRILQTVVYCLLRESPGLTAMDRIHSSLEKFGIAQFDENLKLRIVPIKGVPFQRCRVCHVQYEGQSRCITDMMNVEIGTLSLLVMILSSLEYRD
jgi:hypothetical protein